jgi:hypothetical protein
MVVSGVEIGLIMDFIVRLMEMTSIFAVLDA